jgi:PIN like domain
VKFILDEHLPPVLARSLDTLFKGEHEVVALRDKFGQGVTDVEWITSLSHEGRWIIISGDRRITRNKAEYNAFRASRLIGFFLSASVYKSPVNKQAARLLILWDDICEVANRVQGGAMFEIPAKAKVRQLKL